MTHLKNIKLSEKSYYKTGGVCKHFFLPENILQLEQYLKLIKDHKMDFFILGAGSNSLVSDSFWDGGVLCLEKLNWIYTKDSKIICGAGVSNSEVAKYASNKELSGCSWLYGLPGLIGGTVRMNARCYGGEISQIADEVIGFSKDSRKHHYKDEIKNKNCFHGYKDTIFMKNEEIIAQVTLKLEKGIKKEIEDKMKSCFEDREKKGQFDLPSCGCVFKNNYTAGVPSGMLIDLCGLRGREHGGAQIHNKHCNFIVNKNNATSKDILELSFYVRDKVWQKFGLWLEYEMEVLGSLESKLRTKFEEKRENSFKKDILQKAQEKFRQSK